MSSVIMSSGKGSVIRGKSGMWTVRAISLCVMVSLVD